ncbi:hypothetical protein [Novosphingobium colocasiae]|uniref:hypothetical protein n=1 Tax=Novosphingobium colocasiae TaxID=1256513 RepID=UPI0035B4C681
MAAKPLELPAYIQARYEEQGVFSKLKNDAANATSVVRREFDELSSSITKSFEQMKRGGGLSLDLGTDEMRRALQLQQARAAAAEEYANAARRAAAADGGRSRELQLAAAAADAMAQKEREAAAAAAVHADVIGRVTAELSREASGTESSIAAYRRLAGANDNVTRSAGSHRMAMIGVGQQLQDSVVQLQMGTSALTVFAQQGSQAAYQLAGMGGKVGAVASVLAGPWGAAIFAGTTLLGPLISGLFKTSEALDDVKFASDGVTTAQGILGAVLDISTGKLTTQRSALLALAEAQILVNKVQAQQRAMEARQAVQAIQDRPLQAEGGGLGGGFSVGRRPLDARDAISRDVLAGTLDAKTAIERLDNLRKAGRLTGDEFNQAAAAVANFNVELANIESFEKADALLNGRGGRDLLKPAKATKPKVDHTAEQASREAERLATFGKQASESIARLNSQFDEQPRLIDQATQATRQLDATIAELQQRKPPGFEQMIADAEHAKATVQDALVRPYRELAKDTERRLQIQSLLARGMEDEAAAVQQIWQFEDRVGNLTDDQRASVRALVIEEQRRTRELQAQQALFEAQIDVLDQAKRSLTDMLSGRGGNPLKEIGQSLKDLQGKRLFQSLFGSTFRQIEDELRGQSPLDRESQALADKMLLAERATTSLTDAFDFGARAIRNAASNIGAANDNGPSAAALAAFSYLNPPKAPSLADADKQKLGTAGRAMHAEIEQRSITSLAMSIGRATADPITAALDKMLGTTFFQNMSGILAGVIGGQAVGGTTGAVLGGLRGAVFDFGPDLVGKGKTEDLLAGFDKAMAGAQIGTQAAGIMKMLGIKTSTTGAQLGGAAGGLGGPVWAVVGSIAGGLIGGLFKKTDKGYAHGTIDGSGELDYLFAKRHGKGRTGAARTLVEGLYDGLTALSEQLGGGLAHNFSLGSIGTYKKKYVYDPTPGNDADRQMFDTAEEAIKAGIIDAISRGVLTGIRASTKNILSAGKDLDAAVQDALDWENAFRELKSYKDPVGAAIDDLDKQFQHLIDISKDAGASQAEMAQLEELYGIKREEIIKETNERILGSLKGLFDDLTMGDSGLSLRDREAAALAKYQPLAQRVAAGDTTAYDDYAEAARALLDIDRQMYGSQQQYFDRLNEITNLTKTRIDAESNISSIAQNRDNPFDSTGAVNTSINTQTDVLSSHLDAVNQNLGRVLSTLNLMAANGSSASVAARLAFANSF